MRALDRVILRGYLAWLTELGYVRHSVSRKLSTLRTFLKWMSSKGIIEGDPLPKRGIMRVPKRLPRFLSQEQAERLMDAPDVTKPMGLRDQALLEVIYGAGLRVSEASNLRVTDINLSTREIRVRGKGSKERVVLIGETAKGALSLYLERRTSETSRQGQRHDAVPEPIRRSSEPAQHTGEGEAIQRQGGAAVRGAYAHLAPLIRHPPA